MNYKIVADSCCDMPDELKKEVGVEVVPLTIRIEDREFIDDDTLDIEEYLDAMSNSKTPPKTACPSIQDFIDKYNKAKDIFVVTLSSKLSGTYNAAVQAKDILLESVNDKFVHVFDSMSASIGQTLVSLKIHEQIKNNIKKSEIIEKVNSYIKEMKTFFLLENIDNLVKSGRLNPFIAKAANILSIKPIMGSDDGEIRLVHKVRGYERAFKRLVDVIGEEGKNLEEKILGIAHCNCLQRAQDFKKMVQQKYRFKDIIIVEMCGTISTYANKGGLVIAF